MSKSDNKQLQRALREIIEPTMVVDGNWGNQSNIALGKFANAQALTIGDAKLQLHIYAETRYVNDDAFVEASKNLGVPQSYVRAIAECESSGESFLKDGSVKILFERHWFKRKLAEALKNVTVRTHVASKLGGAVGSAETILALVEKKYENLCSSERGGYKGGYAEWDRLNLAMDLDIESACMAASYGGYQLMGFNHKVCGYNTAKAMMLALAVSESKHFLAMVAFIKGNSGMHAALKAGNWAKFAQQYNGPAYKENHYDTKLASSENKWKVENVA